MQTLGELQYYISEAVSSSNYRVSISRTDAMSQRIEAIDLRRSNRDRIE
jgi:hypothetical protein